MLVRGWSLFSVSTIESSRVLLISNVALHGILCVCVCTCVRVCTCCSAVKPQEDGGVSDQLYAEIKPAVDGANYIIKHMHNKNNYNEVRRRWAWPAWEGGRGSHTDHHYGK